jgi:alpha-L-fucosidase
MFVHYGLNTFHGVEWSDGTLPAASFDPARLDADQWVRTAVAFGALYLVLTAKHHDGFCLWPTATTGYSVRSSPWRGGRGDLVGEVAAACRRHHVAFGVYLSPWDRNAPCYADPAAYSEFYVRQLAELCTGYGSIAEVWLDGAGSEGYRYDWDSIMAVVDRHQPGAMVFNLGRPTIRWVGNEDGLAADPNHYVVERAAMSQYTDTAIALGERAYLPPECDVSLRRGWFHHPDDEPKSLKHLLAIHERSVGLGANLLLNVPPTREGVVAEEDRIRVTELGEELRRRYGRPLAARLEQVDVTTWVARWDQPVTWGALELREDLTDGQRVDGFRVLVDGTEVARGSTVGVRRLVRVPSTTADRVVVQLEGDRPTLRALCAHRGGAAPSIPTGSEAPTTRPDDP